MSESSADDDRRLTVELTEVMLAQLAPDELAILPEISDEFFENPDRAVKTAKEESLGFGIELALLAPFALAVAMEVIKFLLQLAKDTVGPDLKNAFSRWVKSLTKKPTTEAQHPVAPPLSREQLVMVRSVAYSRARDLGVDEAQARALADAVVGGVLLTDPGPQPA